MKKKTETERQRDREAERQRDKKSKDSVVEDRPKIGVEHARRHVNDDDDIAGQGLAHVQQLRLLPVTC
jgi:capsid protein